MARIWRALGRQPRLLPELHNEAELVFCIGKTSFNNEDSIHLRILQTIFAKLNNETRPCPRYGQHWERLGFQQSDPTTDLRDLGMLSPLQLLYLTTDKYAADARTILQFSAGDDGFPFAAVAINLTKVTLHALRIGSLIPECNARREVLPVLNRFFVGAFFEYYKQWRTKKMTIHSGGFHIVHVLIERKACDQPQYIFRNLDQGLWRARDASALADPKDTVDFSAMG